MDNPLLDFTDLPLFDRIRPEHIAPAVAELLGAADQALAQVTAPGFSADWTQMSRVLDVCTERLSRAWSVVSHINSVADTPAWREAYNAALPQVTEFWTRLGSDAALFAQYRAMDPAGLNPEQARAHHNAVRNFVLGGAQLEAAAKQRFAEIQDQQAELTQRFGEHCLDATDAWSCQAGEAELAGVPEDVKQAARRAAEQAQQAGYRLTLKMPCYLPVIQFAQNRALREKMYRAYVTRASELGDAPARDNTPLIQNLLALRHEEAALLGYPHFAALSLVPKMAESAPQVLAFLRDLAHRARPYALKDLDDLRAFAREQLQIDDPQAWDWAFIGEKLKEARYAYNEQDVKAYFPAPRVIAGLFQLAQTLFELDIRPDQAPVWHPDVRFFRIERQGRLIGQFYLDLSARTGKRGGAWMADVRNRWLRPDSGQVQTPVAQLVCNFAEGVDGKPPLLTHDDVITLFHEFGHGLHHLLTRVNEQDVSGISGVEWDAVELPSQFMENFCWEWNVLRHLSGHVDSGAALPRALFDKMLAAKNFQSGLQTLRQIEFALFDMALHSQPQAVSDFMAVLNQVRAEVAVLPAPPFNRMAHTFSHIFAGGYAAGYYSYKWAEVLSADAYAAFEESADAQGQPSAATGRRYREEILEVGGSRPALSSFAAFRGRPPELDALLRHQGMAPPGAAAQAGTC